MLSHPPVQPCRASCASVVTPHRLPGSYTYAAAAAAAPPEVDKFPQWLLTQLPLSSGATSRCCFHSHPGSRTDFLVTLLTPACYYQRWLRTTLPLPIPTHHQSSRDFYSFPGSLSFCLLASFTLFSPLFFLTACSPATNKSQRGPSLEVGAEGSMGIKPSRLPPALCSASSEILMWV